MMMVCGQVSNCLFEDFDVAFQPVATIGKARFTGNTLTGGNGNVVFFTVSGAAPLACRLFRSLTAASWRTVFARLAALEQRILARLGAAILHLRHDRHHDWRRGHGRCDLAQ